MTRDATIRPTRPVTSTDSELTEEAPLVPEIGGSTSPSTADPDRAELAALRREIEALRERLDRLEAGTEDRR